MTRSLAEHQTYQAESEPRSSQDACPSSRAESSGEPRG